MNSFESQYSLLTQRRFLPLFVTQFLGAFNDNIFKNALVLLIAYRLTTSLDTGLLINLAAGLFILPFFLFSALAGQLADRFEKSRLIRLLKLAEIVIMIIGALALASDNPWFLLGVLFLMGSQSAFFGPIKYGILPQYLKDSELVGGNGLIETGTFLAILSGIILGGVLIGNFENGTTLVSVTVIAMAVSGYLASCFTPSVPVSDPDVAITPNIFSATVRAIGFAREDKNVFLAILGISWFWFFGAVFLTQFPIYAKSVLHGNENVATLLLAAFSVGIACGSLLCERLSRNRVETGLVPLGSIGMTVFALHLAFATPVRPAGDSLWTLQAFLWHTAHLRILFDLVMLSFFAGLFIVPLYAFVQSRCRPTHRSRIIAANNIINALFMVVAAVSMVVLLGAGVSIAGLFIFVALLNAIAAACIYTLVPEFIMRLVAWVLVHTIYRLKHVDLDKVPDEGAAILVCNHVSFVDVLVITAVMKRPVRFVMPVQIYNTAVIHWLFKSARAIPVASGRGNTALLVQTCDDIATALDNDELIAIFPEGAMTCDGEVAAFKKDIEKIVQQTPVPVVPLALKGLWGSLFSRKYKGLFAGFQGMLWTRIEIVADEVVKPENVTAELLYEKVTSLRGSMA